MCSKQTGIGLIRIQIAIQMQSMGGGGTPYGPNPGAPGLLPCNPSSTSGFP
jgi:hypothetical protein